MQNKSPSQVLSKIIVFDISTIRIFSGRKKLNETDFIGVDTTKLPPSTLASLGSKKIIDTTELNGFSALKRRAHLICESMGIRFLAGYAIPRTQAHVVAQKLDELQEKFYELKKEFLANYQAKIQAWANDHPDHAQQILAAAPTQAYVDKHLQFEYTPFPVAEVGDPILDKSLSSAVTSLSQQLFDEVAAKASELYQDGIMGREKITRHIVTSVQTLRNKLQSLEFLDSRVSPVVVLIDHSIGMISKNGPYEGLEKLAIERLVTLLAAPDELKMLGQRINEGKSAESEFDMFILQTSSRGNAENVFETAAVDPPLTPMVPTTSREEVGPVGVEEGSSINAIPGFSSFPVVGSFAVLN